MKMLRAFYRQATRRLRQQALLYGNQRVYEPNVSSAGSLNGKGNTNPLLDPGGLKSKLHTKAWECGPAKANRNTWHHTKVTSGMCASTARAMMTPSLICHHNIPIRYSNIDYDTPKGMDGSLQIHGSHVLRMHPGSLLTIAIEGSVKTHPTHVLGVHNLNVFRSNACLNLRRTYSNSAKVQEQTTENKEINNHKDMCMQPEDSEEIMSFIVDGDISAVANELRQAQQDMIVQMRRCSRVLFAVSAMHLMSGGMMFFALESPLNHAVMTEVCMSTLVIGGLAYQLKQTIKPVEFFANHEEHQRMRIIFLSRQISRMLATFFHRGRGIAFVLSLTLAAHTLSCIRFFL